jgi:hypothetical protein
MITGRLFQSAANAPLLARRRLKYKRDQRLFLKIICQILTGIANIELVEPTNNSNITKSNFTGSSNGFNIV